MVIATIAVAARVLTRADHLSFRGQLAAAARFANTLERSLQRLPADSLRTADALTAIYLERHRLGLGSPFRLIDQALREPALDAAARRRLGYALLARTLAGNGYRTDAAALDLVSAKAEQWRSAGPGAFHLALIEGAVGRARDPRAGELAVRLSYQLAAASGAVSPRAAELASGAAAQARDRLLAMRDARLLIEAAERTSTDLFSMMRVWRETRRFLVEAPTITPLPSRSERVAAEAVPGLLARLEELGRSGEGSSWVSEPRSDGRAEMPGHHATLVSEGVARRMVAVAAGRRGPPQPPVSVVVAGYTPLMRRAGRDAYERSIRSRFAESARNEETLAAEFMLLRRRLPDGAPEASAAVLTAAVALRPFAQERAWLPNDLAPSDRELQSRYGVTVRYDAQVPADWRSYLRRALALALDDMSRVFPGFDSRGLHVRFGESPLRERALALHDPVSRTVYLPPASSAGVMAHEFAHDLDWQAARRYYGSSVGYRTDRAVRQTSTDRLASALRRMASAPRVEAEQRADPGARPTEVFARNIDWFVSAALSRQGRMNGYLSAVQDPLLTGYGSAISPEVTRDGASATLRALDGMTPVAPELRSWYEEQFGANRRITSHEAIRRVLETPLSPIVLRRPSLSAMSSFEAAAALFRSVPQASAAWSCALDAFVRRSVDERASRAMVVLAAEARARGVVRRWKLFARHYSAWAVLPFHTFEAAPWDPAITEEAIRDVRDAILWRALGAAAPDASEAPFFSTAATPARCGG